MKEADQASWRRCSLSPPGAYSQPMRKRVVNQTVSMNAQSMNNKHKAELKKKNIKIKNGHEAVCDRMGSESQVGYPI